MRTPCFVYDLDVVTTAWHGLSAALEATGVRYRVAYAIKVNPLRPILAHLRSLGADAEIVSLRELRAARAAGFQTDRVIVNGPMKPPELLSPAGRAGAIINLESRRQLEALAQAGTAESGQVGLRLAPDEKSRSSTERLVTLQRDPPLTRIFAPIRLAPSRHCRFSAGSARAAKIAVASPAAPAPTTTTSVWPDASLIR